MTTNDRSTRVFSAGELGLFFVTSINDLVRFGLPADYWDTYATAVRGVTHDAASKAAADYYATDQLTWIIVGDRAKIESGIRELKLGPLQVIDADGNVLADSAVSE